MVKMKLSVVLCTHNPTRAALENCLGSVAMQEISAADFELIVVDNCCKPPLNKAELEGFFDRDVVLVREPRPGLVHARVTGFQTAKHNVIVFIDDDNEFFPDYLSHVQRIASEEPTLGVFGGRCIGAFDRPPPRIKEFFLPFLGVREPSNEPLTGEGREWGPHEPIGAGIVVRKPIGDLYCRFVNEDGAGAGLGRTGTQLLSGEDSLLSRFAYRTGYLCGYRPELRLLHHIGSGRFKWGYLARLMRGHGTSFVRLARISDGDSDPAFLDPIMIRKVLVSNFLWRTRRMGLVGAIAHIFWDLGVYEALNEKTNSQAFGTEFEGARSRISSGQM